MEKVTRSGEGRHKACPYRWCQGVMVRVTRSGVGRHKACPYRWVRGDGEGDAFGGGQAQGLPLPVGEG